MYAEGLACRKLSLRSLVVMTQVVFLLEQGQRPKDVHTFISPMILFRQEVSTVSPLSSSTKILCKLLKTTKNAHFQRIGPNCASRLLD